MGSLREFYFILLISNERTRLQYAETSMNLTCNELNAHSVLLSELKILYLVVTEEFKTQPLVYAGGGSMSGPGSEQ